MQPARDIIRRIRKRSLYAFVDEYLVPSALADKIPNVTSLDISTHNVTSLNLRPEDIIVHDGKVNYNLQVKIVKALNFDYIYEAIIIGSKSNR